MTQSLPQTNIYIPRANNPVKTVEYINSYINNTNCENMSIDISFLNVIDACYVSTMCSTNHFVKYPKGKINWIISSELVKTFNKNLELGNAEYSIV